MPLSDTAAIAGTPTPTSGATAPSARFEYTSPFTAMTSGTTYVVPFNATNWNDINGLTLNADGSLTFATAAAGKYLINAFLGFGASAIPLTLVIAPNTSDTADTVSEQDGSAGTAGSLTATGNVEGMHQFAAGDILYVVATQYSGSSQTPTGASVQLVRVGPTTVQHVSNPNEVAIYLAAAGFLGMPSNPSFIDYTNSNFNVPLTGGGWTTLSATPLTIGGANVGIWTYAKQHTISSQWSGATGGVPGVVGVFCYQLPMGVLPTVLSTNNAGPATAQTVGDTAVKVPGPGIVFFAFSTGNGISPIETVTPHLPMTVILPPSELHNFEMQYLAYWRCYKAGTYDLSADRSQWYPVNGSSGQEWVSTYLYVPTPGLNPIQQVSLYASFSAANVTWPQQP